MSFILGVLGYVTGEEVLRRTDADATDSPMAVAGPIIGATIALVIAELAGRMMSFFRHRRA